MNDGWRCSIQVPRTICLEQLLRRLLFVAFVVLSSLVECSSAKALVDRRRNTPALNDQESSSYDDNLQNYLETFGYLPKDNPEMSNLRTDEVIKLAVKRMQEFSGLKPTGVVDDQTKQLLQTKRCGMPDVNYEEAGVRRHKRYSTASKWGKTGLTYYIENEPRQLDRHQTRRAIFEGSKVWTSVSTISLQEIGDNSADINIKFESGNHSDSYPFDGPGVVLAHAFFPGSGLGGDIHFDADERWTDRTEQYGPRSINLLTTAAHEFGHSLGLGHSKVREALMYPYYKAGMGEVKLHYDDILGIQKHYGVGTSGTPTSPAPTSPTIPFWVPVATLPSVPVSTTTPPPHPCDTHIDAIARLRGETFVFKNKYYWRFNENGQLVEPPAEIIRFWIGLPSNLTKIDAVYEWSERDRVTMFIGRQYYDFSANRLRGIGDIGEFGLPTDLKHIDAAFVWEYNGKTYFFAGDQYWRLDENERKVEPDYPRKIPTIWENVPNNVDAAFTDKSGTTYFFKDEMIYKFNDYFMRVEKSYPRQIKSYWGYCPPENIAIDPVNSSINVKCCTNATVLFWLSFVYSVLYAVTS